MKNFEERYTAWLDGTMKAAERARFEAELPDVAAAQRDAKEWRDVRAGMRTALAVESMPHADFLNSRVLETIEREAAEGRRDSGSERGSFPVGRLAWSGAFLIILATGLSFLLLPRDDGLNESRFISQVIDARSADPKLGAYAFAAPGGKGAVLWVTDAGFIPANERIK